MYLFVFKQNGKNVATEQLILKATYAYCEACYGPAYECACCRGCGIADSEHMPTIKRTENGKPYFVGDNMPCFSVSHSGTYTLIAMAPFEIGVDIQFVKAVSTALKEKMGMAEMSDAEVISRWTKAEAYTKYVGGKILENLNIDFSPDVHFEKVEIVPSYICTVCAAKEENIWVKEIK